MKKLISLLLLSLALCQLIQLAAAVGIFKAIIYALCGAYIFNFALSLIVDTSDSAKRGTEQIKRVCEHSENAD